MADADLDVVIRKLAKQHNTTLKSAIKARRDYFAALAAKAKTPEAKQHLKQLAKDAVEHGHAALKRLQMSADNAADSYARAIRKAAEAFKPPKAAEAAKLPKTKKAPKAPKT